MPGDEDRKRKWLPWWFSTQGLNDMLGLARESWFFTPSADNLNPGMLAGLTKELVLGHWYYGHHFVFLIFNFPLYGHVT